jgi:hypothetical protein
MISQAVETSSEKSCAALCELLGALRGLTVTGLPGPLLAPADVKEAVYRFLNNFDDVLIDAPKAVRDSWEFVAFACMWRPAASELEHVCGCWCAT